MKTETSYYNPPDIKSWQGRADSPANSCFFQLIQPLDLNRIPSNLSAGAFAVLGFCCDEGINRNLGRPGAAEGPLAIREILARLPVQKQNLICFDAGDIICNDKNLEAAQEKLGNAVATLLQHNIVPIILGGGHELAFGNYQGIAKVFPHERLGIINFDAHFDMRPLLANGQGTSGTPFLQIAEAHKKTNQIFDYNCIGIQQADNTRQLFETAKKYNAHIIFADDIYQGFTEKCISFVDRVIEQNEILYTSLCLDVFGAAFAPGVSAPQTLGLNPWHIIPLIRELAASGKVVSYDIAELSPKYDIDNRTAKLAANFIFEIIHHHSHQPRKNNATT